MATIDECKAEPWLVDQDDRGNCGFAGPLMAVMDRYRLGGDSSLGTAFHYLTKYVKTFNDPKEVLNRLWYCFSQKTLGSSFGGGWSYWVPGTLNTTVKGSGDWWTKKNEAAPRRRITGDHDDREDLRWILGVGELYRLWSIDQESSAGWDACNDYSQLFGWALSATTGLRYQGLGGGTSTVHGDLAVPPNRIDSILKLLGMKQESFLSLLTAAPTGPQLVDQPVLTRTLGEQLRVLQGGGQRGNLIPADSDGAILGLGVPNFPNYTHRNWLPGYEWTLHWVYVPYNPPARPTGVNAPGQSDFQLWTYGKRWHMYDGGIDGVRNAKIGGHDFAPTCVVFVHKDMSV